MVWERSGLFFSHSQKLGQWGFLEKFTITPTHHLLHHSCNEDHLNRNFGETFLFWDYLFGTFKKTTQTLRFGIGGPIDTDVFRQVVLQEFDRMRAEWRVAFSFEQ